MFKRLFSFTHGACARRRRSLREMPAGRTLKVSALCGSPPVRLRLCALGIVPGTELEICWPDGGDCVRVRVRGSSLVLDGGMAEAVECLCCSLPEEELQTAGRQGDENGETAGNEQPRGLFRAWLGRHYNHERRHTHGRPHK